MRISDWSSDVCSSDLVIITENGDRLLALDRIGQPLSRLVHVAENGRIGHEAANGRHPMALQLLAHDAPCEQQLVDQIVRHERRVSPLSRRPAPPQGQAEYRVRDRKRTRLNYRH